CHLIGQWTSSRSGITEGVSMTDDVRDAAQKKPGSQHENLGVFLGRWHTLGEVAASASNPAAKVDAIDTL
ncbi:MAG: hypothetical protein ACREON_12450, partial [Gemmatimonadaceae bacterium]